MKKQTQEEFLNKMELVNPNIQILSNYTSDKGKVKCLCKICNHEWEDSATHLKQGRGCGNCKRIQKRKENAKEFFLNSEKIHNNKYDYSKFQYVDSYTKGIIICPIHGEFEQIPNSHVKGRGCPLCAGNNYKRDTEEFIYRARKIHKNKYNYNKVEYKTCKDKVLITCNKCNQNFLQTPDHHLQGEGCPYCNLKSQSELYNKLKQSFPSEQILFEVGSNIVPWLQKQRFDIYLPKYNIAIEYNGEQHYIAKEYFGGVIGFNATQDRDQTKREKCKENNCILFEMRYDYSEDDYNNLVKNIHNIIYVS